MNKIRTLLGKNWWVLGVDFHRNSCGLSSIQLKIICKKLTIAGPMRNEAEGPDLMEVEVYSERSGRMKAKIVTPAEVRWKRRR